MICQSCATLIRTPGTEADGTVSKKFCVRCYRDGTFMDPAETMRGVLEKCMTLVARETRWKARR